jgi:hypothetical protein
LRSLLLFNLLKPPHPPVESKTGTELGPSTVNQDEDTHNRDGYFDLIGGSSRCKNSDNR